MATNVLNHFYALLVQLVFTMNAVYRTHPKQFEALDAEPTTIVSYLPLSHIAGLVSVSCDNHVTVM